jgi:hypothetical protein
MSWEDRLKDLVDGVANVDLYEYKVEIVDLDDGRRQVRYNIAMPATEATDEWVREAKRHGEQTGFAAVTAQVVFFQMREKATRKMRKAVEPLLKRMVKVAQKAAGG